MSTETLELTKLKVVFGEKWASFVEKMPNWEKDLKLASFDTLANGLQKSPLDFNFIESCAMANALVEYFKARMTPKRERDSTGSDSSNRSASIKKLEFTTEIKEGIAFLAKFPPEFKLNTFADIPSHPNMAGPKNDDRLIYTDQHKTHLKDVMFRQVISDCKATIVNNDGKKSGKFYLYGMHGTGKSHTLYMASLYWLHEPLKKTHRLLYFGDCGVWANKMTQDNESFGAVHYLLKQLAVCFCNDHTIIDTIKETDIHQPTEVALTLEKLFTETIPSAKLKVWVVFDQHNRIPAEKRKLFPFTIVEKDMLDYTTFFNNGGRLIVSASANNEYKEINSLTKIFEPMLPATYTDEELKVFKTMFNNVVDAKLDLRRLTGHVPYQLAKLSRNISSFEEDIRGEIRGKVDMWLRELGKEKRGDILIQQLQNSVFAMKNEIAVTSKDLGKLLIDNRFQYLDSEISVVVPLSPIIGETYESLFTVENLKIAGWTMLKDMQVDNGTKGRIVESMVINHLVSEKKVPAPDATTMVKFSHTVRWVGMRSLPSLEEIGDAKGKNILFWPRTSNYVDVDFLLWDHSNATLWAVQITIKETHSFTFQDYLEEWKKLMESLLPKTKKNGVAVKFVWWGYHPKLITNANQKLLEDQIFFNLDHFATSNVIPVWANGSFVQ